MKNALKSIVFIGILFVLLISISYLLLPREGVFRYGIIKTAEYEILGEKKDSIDVVFVGDSLIYSGISPMEIWNQFGYTSFDMANAAQLLEVSYKDIQVAIESQHPKFIFLESNVLYRESKNKPWNYDWVHFFETYVPIQKYHDNWKKYVLPWIDDTAKFSRINVYKGFRYITDHQKGTNLSYMDYSKKVKKIPEENKKWLQKIQALCQENHVTLLLISTPNMKNWNYKKHNGTKEVADEYGIEFLDLNIDNPVQIEWSIDSRDGGNHLNYKGAKKLSHYLGEYLKKTGILTDHRSDSHYESWNEAYQVYSNHLK